MANSRSTKKNTSAEPVNPPANQAEPTKTAKVTKVAKDAKVAKTKQVKASEAVQKQETAPVQAVQVVQADVEEVEEPGRRFWKCVFIKDGQVIASGRYSGRKPKQAASKACTKQYEEMKDGEDVNKIIFGMHECTRATKKKRKYFYTGERIVLDKPEEVAINVPVRDENGNIKRDANGKALKEPKTDASGKQMTIKYYHNNVIRKLTNIPGLDDASRAVYNRLLTYDLPEGTTVTIDGHAKLPKKKVVRKSKKTARKAKKADSSKVESSKAESSKAETSTSVTSAPEATANVVASTDAKTTVKSANKSAPKSAKTKNSKPKKAENKAETVVVKEANVRVSKKKSTKPEATQASEQHVDQSTVQTQSQVQTQAPATTVEKASGKGKATQRANTKAKNKA